MVNSTPTSALSSSLSLGPVSLRVKDLHVMTAFYHEVLELSILSSTDSSITLGKRTIPLLTLHEALDTPSPHPGHAGLYHFAIVFSSRGELSRTLHHILTNAPQFFSGSGDHLVSEAFYFTDPEGNGIELYFDRDRSAWEWQDTQIKMATLYIDPEEYIQSYMVEEDTNATVRMGHIHLKVGSITEAKQFYVDTLGFEITAQLPGALFVSVGGYHHHIGMNTWESQGAGIRSHSLGLHQFIFVVPDATDIDALELRLKSSSLPYTKVDESITLDDPWGNQLVITTAISL